VVFLFAGRAVATAKVPSILLLIIHVLPGVTFVVLRRKLIQITNDD
jgi:hypothetical protein